ncbi:MAG: YibE/F family protein [Candidatus Paceibacteria bacterium]
MSRWLFGVVTGLSLLIGGVSVSAQEVHQELQETVRAEVLEIVEQYDRDILGTGATTTVQELRAKLLSGSKEGEVVRFENDLMVLEVGDKIFVNRLIAIDGEEYYTFKDIERRPQLLILAIVLSILVVVFARWQGLRALLSLALSAIAIIFLLVPALLAGYDPALASFAIAAVILALTLFLTHGFGIYVRIAYFGTMAAVGVTCLIAWVSVSWLHLTGFSADASVYLNFATGGQLDLAGLLLGGIIIGLLGVLDDVSITQASVVQELRRANPTLGIRSLYERGVRVGRDHVGSLVNTLALAYVGTTLPLVLLYAQSQAPFLDILNQEVVAAELVRIIVGSIGLVLAVPFTTLVAAYYFSRHEIDNDSSPSHNHHHYH